MLPVGCNADPSVPTDGTSGYGPAMAPPAGSDRSAASTGAQVRTRNSLRAQTQRRERIAKRCDRIGEIKVHAGGVIIGVCHRDPSFIDDYEAGRTNSADPCP